MCLLDIFFLLTCCSWNFVFAYPTHNDKKVREQQIVDLITNITNLQPPIQHDIPQFATRHTPVYVTSTERCENREQLCCIESYRFNLAAFYKGLVAPTTLDIGVCRGGCHERGNERCVVTRSYSADLIFSNSTDSATVYKVHVYAGECTCYVDRP